MLHLGRVLSDLVAEGFNLLHLFVVGLCQLFILLCQALDEIVFALQDFFDVCDGVLEQVHVGAVSSGKILHEQNEKLGILYLLNGQSAIV